MQASISKEEERRYEELLLMAIDFARADESNTLLSMIEYGLNVNLEDHKGNTLLMLATYNNNYKTAKMLIEKGADVNKENSHGHTPLMGVAFKGYLDICKLLVENGAIIKPKGKSSAVLFASLFGRDEVVKYLLSVDDKTNSGFLNSFFTKLAAFVSKVRGAFKTFNSKV